MQEDSSDHDLRDVMAEEKRRGTRRRAIDTAERKKRLQLERDALRAIKSGDLHAYVRMLHEAGMKDGSPEYANALKIFQSFHGRR
jgi:hypothetical protein